MNSIKVGIVAIYLLLLTILLELPRAEPEFVLEGLSAVLLPISGIFFAYYCLTAILDWVSRR